ncbi:hypothetical protein CRI94_07115 [Longibacter salinarum]|uniref:Dihydrolipoamide dehydrogenase n=1 Tax=Longibacter salinarum TaxID=1850348 RepID=A0A2A8CZ26_9BACT|nr:DUF2911 domain-containing protein [Longibacter salinarum]PEN13827.1 hypothetical protein CRI94_07115 [Longibacter salinarum]
MTLIRRFASVFSLTMLVFAVTMVVPDTAAAQERNSMLPRVSPNASVSQSIGVTTVEVHYGRPAVRDRQVFGKLVPYGDVWRTGANEATVIAFSTPVQIEGESLDAGMYSLFTVPGEEEWTFIFNDTVEQWGAYNYEESKDVLRVTTEPTTGPMHERLTFAFPSVTDSSATLALMWDETRVPLEITVDTKEVIASRAASAVDAAENWQTPLQYAGYALQNDILIEEAIDWTDASLEIQETFPALAVKARLQAKNGDYQSAIESAERAVELAENMEETPRGLEGLKNALEEWKAK